MKFSSFFIVLIFALASQGCSSETASYEGRNIKEWRKDLKDLKVEVRERATVAFISFANTEPHALVDLINARSEEGLDWDYWENIGKEELASSAANTAPVLVRVIKDNPGLREVGNIVHSKQDAACAILFGIADEASVVMAIPELWGILDRVEDRHTLLSLIKEIVNTASYLDESWCSRDNISTIIVDICNDYINSNDDDNLFYYAISIASDLCNPTDDEGRAVVGALTALAIDTNNDINRRIYAIRALADIKSLSENAKTQRHNCLILLVADPEISIQRTAVICLANESPMQEDTIELLFTVLKDTPDTADPFGKSGHNNIRTYAAKGLSNHCDDIQRVNEALLQAIVATGERTEIRQKAVLMNIKKKFNKEHGSP